MPDIYRNQQGYLMINEGNGWVNASLMFVEGEIIEGAARSLGISEEDLREKLSNTEEVVKQGKVSVIRANSQTISYNK